MAPKSTDDNLVFLYKCLQATPAKIDYNLLSTTTGLNVPAARMRFSRLKDKLLENNADLAPAHAANTSSAPKAPRPIAPSASVPRKRKAACTSSNNDIMQEQSSAKNTGSGPGEGSNADKRQTRGKKLNYDLSALYCSDEDGSDHTAISHESDGDFRINEGGPSSQVDSNLNSDSEDEIKPDGKRFKQALGGIVSGSAKQTSSNRKNNSIARKRIPAAKLKLPATESVFAKYSPAPQKKDPAKAPLYPFDRPIPSIETSPPRSIDSSYDESKTESDIDIKRLQPGTILSFGSSGTGSACHNTLGMGKRVQVTNGAPREVFITAKTTSNVSTQDSADAVLNLELRNHAQEVAPEDSVSMVNSRNEAPPPSTPPPPMTGKTTFQRFKGLLSPWKSG